MSVSPIELADVYRRHHRAMQVVGRVPEEPSRWLLLDTVLGGNERVEAALERVTRLPARSLPGPAPVLSERHRAVVRMRNEGMSFRAIGERLELTEQGAYYAYRSCLKKLTA